jgi:hypothetical protein
MRANDQDRTDHMIRRLDALIRRDVVHSGSGVRANVFVTDIDPDFARFAETMALVLRTLVRLR